MTDLLSTTADTDGITARAFSGRRGFLKLLAAGSALAAAGCTQAQISAGLSTAITYIANIASGAIKALPTIGTITGISTATLATIGGYVSDLQAVAAAAVTSMQTAGQSLLAKLWSLLNAITTALAALNVIPAPFSMVLTAWNALMPYIQAAVEAFFGPTPAPVPVPAMARLASPLSPDQANNILVNPYGAAPAFAPRAAMPAGVNEHGLNRMELQRH